MWQQYEAGETLTKGSSVKLIVSKGPKPTTTKPTTTKPTTTKAPKPEPTEPTEPSEEEESDER